MGKLLEKFGPNAAGVFLIWFCWSNLGNDDSKRMIEKPQLPTITAEFLPLRGVAEEPSIVRNPFRVKWNSSSGSGTNLSQGTKLSVGTISSPRAELSRGAKSSADTKFSPEYPPANSVLMTKEPQAKHVEPFTLWLEAILELPEGKQARLCGHTVLVGGIVPGLDPESPPVLIRVDGPSAEVAYRGRSYILHLDKRPSAVVDLRAVPEGTEGHDSQGVRGGGK